MKKILFPGFIATLLASFAINVAVSQNLDNTPNLVPSNSSENDYSLPTNSIKNSDALRLNEVSSKAVRHFTKTYKNVDSVRWSRLRDGNGGFGAYFVTGGIPTSVRYDQGGNYECSFREYYEANLPREIRHQIKSVYYDFAIRFIKEVNMHNNTVHLVTLEDTEGWKHILVTEQKIVVLTEFLKASPGKPAN